MTQDRYAQPPLRIGLALDLDGRSSDMQPIVQQPTAVLEQVRAPNDRLDVWVTQTTRAGLSFATAGGTAEAGGPDVD